MVLEQRQQDFLQYLRFEKRYSHHTLSAYHSDLDQFLQFIKANFDLTEPADVTHFHIRSWLAGMKEQDQTPRTINRKRSSLHSFFRFLLKQNIVPANPVTQLHSLKLPERLPSFMKEKETEHLLEEIQFDAGFKGATDRLICELLYQTGMRRNELLQLKEDNIEWSLKQVRILGKGNKERLVPLGEALLAEIKAYQELKKNVDNYDRDHLLIRESGKPLYAGYIYNVVKRYLNITTTLKKKSPHVLRHTFATHLLNNGANIQAIKDLLGHSSLAATQIYAHNNIDKLKDVHKLNHPRG
jgi:integrase/recombinase XerC